MPMTCMAAVFKERDNRYKDTVTLLTKSSVVSINHESIQILLLLTRHAPNQSFRISHVVNCGTNGTYDLYIIKNYTVVHVSFISPCVHKGIVK